MWTDKIGRKVRVPIRPISTLLASTPLKRSSDIVNFLLLLNLEPAKSNTSGKT